MGSLRWPSTLSIALKDVVICCLPAGIEVALFIAQ
jgi:hypothetical protein